MNDYVSLKMLKGIGLVVGGILLLLYTFGLLQNGMNMVLMAAAIVIIAYGLIMSGVYDYVMQFAKKTLKK